MMDAHRPWDLVQIDHDLLGLTIILALEEAIEPGRWRYRSLL